MRLSVVPLVLGAGLAIQQASAVPIRVVVVTTNQDITPHAGPPVASFIRPINHTTTVTQQIGQTGTGRPMHGCGGMAAKAAAKSAAIAQMFREAFGFAPHHDAAVAHEGETVKILPFIGTPIDYRQAVPSSAPVAQFWDPVNGDPQKQDKTEMGRHHHHAHGMSRHHRGAFVHRINHALVSLGTWEGRAVAFVLGCGIGVLLRMFWVLALVIVRSFKGSKEENETPTEDGAVVYNGVTILFDESELVSPPEYAPAAMEEYPEEKKEPIVADKN